MTRPTQSVLLPPFMNSVMESLAFGLEGLVHIQHPTNQRAEITAIILALETALTRYEKLDWSPRLDVKIYSDSKYAVNCMTIWVDKWFENGWINSAGYDVVNQDLIKKAVDLEGRLLNLGKVTYFWIPRSDNVNADRCCNEELDKMESLIHWISPPRGNSRARSMGNHDEAKAVEAAPDGSIPPPPYTPNQRHDKSLRCPVPMSQLSSLYRPFPATLTAYYQWKVTRVYHLGTSDNHKLFAVSVYAGISDKGPDRPCTVLHNGPSEKDHTLAVAGEPAVWDMKSALSSISLPPLTSTEPDQTTSPTATEAAVTPVHETMVPGVLDDGKTVIFRFAVEVGHPKTGGYRRETFEWRMLKEHELHDVKHGFKLVRSHAGAEAAPLGVLGDDDGEIEVVAVAGWKRMLALSKPFNLQFMGSGQTGELGDRFAVMVVITSLRLWYLDVQSRTTPSIAGA
ncbi:predicted protein [Uncinocarpus reesii 1704]|uniref:ribonuclease H n=1 Tax=Uncinocarpus reesii (strain UAMH 1704) TaxID=336963 RepID=C4JPE7_UNCRE|nr:uncharacterized protein UREG_04529 [Uncinocarpus reesii 1704]EEP79683.1 predicted protein [Uncinocarpus reesii 1704]